MKVLSLFDGISGGRLALQKAGIEVDTYYASEIKQGAIKVTQEHFPDTVQVGDVTKVRYENGVLYTENGDFEVGKIDMLIGGSPCFTKDTLVQTKQGYKNINDVRVGDMVLTHKNRYKPVVATGGDIKNIYELKASGFLKTKTTSEHPYYVVKRDEVENGKPEWLKVSDINIGDYIGTPIIQEENNPYNLSEEDCWLLGRYLADGHLRHNKRKNRKNSYQYGVIYSVGSHKVEHFLQQVTNRHVTYYPHTPSTHRICINSKKMVELIKSIDLGEGAINKKISNIILELPKNLLKEVIRGYFDGDGYINDKNLYVANSISRDLILGLQLAIAKVYGVSAYVYTHTPASIKIIEGRMVNQQPIYILKFNPNKNHAKTFTKHEAIWYPVKNIEQTDVVENVYNIEVEEDNSYTANNAIVHNCQNFSVLGDGKGYDGEKSKLFWEYLRLLKEINPTYFLLENVKMAKKYEDNLNEYLGYKANHLNSSLVSFQTRNRLYWTNINGGYIPAPKDRNVSLQNHLDLDENNLKEAKLNYTPSRVVMWNDGLPDAKNIKVCKNITNADKCSCLTRKQDRSPNSGLIAYDGFARFLTRSEIEKAQTLPLGYLKNCSYTLMQDLAGDGWTIDMIAHIFSFIKKD